MTRTRDAAAFDVQVDAFGKALVFGIFPYTPQPWKNHISKISESKISVFVLYEPWNTAPFAYADGYSPDSSLYPWRAYIYIHLFHFSVHSVFF